MLHNLIEDAIFETVFVQDFFLSDLQIISHIFEKASASLVQILQKYLSNCFDLVGLVLLLRITWDYRSFALRKSCDAFENFFNELMIVIRIRMEIVLGLNLDSLRSYTSSVSGDAGFHQHFVTRRYAEFIASCRYIIGDRQGLASMLDDALLKLTRELDLLLKKLATSQRDAVACNVFYMNNYDLVLSVLKERELECGEKQLYHAKMEKEIATFTTTQINTFACFSRVVEFCKAITPLLERGPEYVQDNPKFREEAVEKIMIEFTNAHKDAITEIHKKLGAFFANNPHSGHAIFQQVLEEIFRWYSQFQAVIRQHFPNLRKSKAYLQETTMLNEIKKVYARE